LEENQILNTQNSAHDDFNWNVDKRNVATYSQEQREELEKSYEQTFKNIE
jgi:small subunit ribosomal protein S1